MSPIARRRPLLRAAAVGGGAYMAGKASARRTAERSAHEADQEARIADLERAQQGEAQQGEAKSAPVPEARKASVADQLSQLSAMHESGALSDEEFTAAKARLLGLPRARGRSAGHDDEDRRWPGSSR